jgi:hypothetical protein
MLLKKKKERESRRVQLKLDSHSKGECQREMPNNHVTPQNPQKVVSLTFPLLQ